LEQPCGATRVQTIFYNRDKRQKTNKLSQEKNTSFPKQLLAEANFDAIFRTKSVC
jgi:hypothetical protein